MSNEQRLVYRVYFNNDALPGDADKLDVMEELFEGLAGLTRSVIAIVAKGEAASVELYGEINEDNVDGLFNNADFVADWEIL